MNTMNRLSTIMKFEFRRTAANKAFIITTILGPFIIIALMVVPGLLGAAGAAEIPEDTKVGYVIQDPALSQGLAASLAASGGIQSIGYSDTASLRQALIAGDIHYALAENDGTERNRTYTLWVTKHRSMILPSLIGNQIREIGLVSKLAAAGLDQNDITQALAGPEIKTIRIDEEGSEIRESETDQLLNFFIVMSFMMLIYMTTLLYGQMIGRSVVGEKQSKTVELVLSSVSPAQLMAGKVLGIGLAGIIQYSVWIGMSLVFMAIAGPVFDISIPAGLSVGNLLYLFVFFLLAYFLYASGYAAVGAASEDEQQMGQSSMIFLIFLIIPILMSSNLAMGGDTAVGKFLSFFPMTAPIVMLTRVIVHEPAAWEVVVSIAIILVTIVLLTWASGRIFRIGILMTGKKYRFKEMIRWLRIR